MQIAMIGLGRMGGNMARRLVKGGHEVVVWDRSREAVDAAVKAGAKGADSLKDVVRQLTPPRTVWVMLPAGEITEKTLAELGGLVQKGDVLIDGGNAFFKDDVRRGKEYGARGIHYMDVGTSGGVWGLERGYCLMVGGPAKEFERLVPIFKTLAPGRGTVMPSAGRAKAKTARSPHAEEGFMHCGPAGAGHFVKMVHNGIEYGMMQAYAEGFDLMRAAASSERAEGERFEINLADVAELWRRGSVVSSWLLDLTADALGEDDQLAEFTGSVADSGEGRWTVQTAVDMAVPAPVLTASLFTRFRSRQARNFGEKLLSAMRAKFGGHGEAKQS